MSFFTCATSAVSFEALMAVSYSQMITSTLCQPARVNSIKARTGNEEAPETGGLGASSVPLGEP
jgi:hypothetical protein